MEIIPSDLATYGGEAKKILDDLQSRNERMFLITVLFLNAAKTKQELDSAVFQTAGIAQKFNCTLNRLDYMQEQGLMAAILRKIKAGTPYVGWSAGSNVACPTICTTNDMPIVEPQSFRAVGAVKFQINPHYLDANPEGHAGETREQRILEYIEANPRRWVAGLREGCMLRHAEGKLELIGKRPMRMFRKGTETFEIEPGGDLSFLL